ncbi:hypothetical protein H0H87_001103, partial [Tephrocybe sp. NHM501043]
MDFILEDTPLASMFDFALPKMKPPPPPPTPPLPPPQKVKRDRKGKKKKAADAPDKSTSALLKPRRRGAAELAELGLADLPADEPIEEGVEGSVEGTEEPVDVHMRELTEEPVVEEATSISAAPPKRERIRTTRPSLSGHDSLPLVNDVDNHSSFVMFNKGWILPSNQKRGGRAPVTPVTPVTPERSSPPARSRPRKRLRT